MLTKARTIVPNSLAEQGILRQ